MWPMLLLLSVLGAVFYFVVLPIIVFYRDSKNFRRYPSLNALAGISDVGFMWEASKGFRSEKLRRLHQIHPVIRIGPNSLSFGCEGAIKDIYGHGTSCTKDQFYEALSGTHYHLADVVDKSEHARKRKVLSSAYALKNLENWEHKVADKTERFIRGCDAACTTNPKDLHFPDPVDYKFDYRAWTNFFTLDAIADIGLSERLGFLDQGNDRVQAETMKGDLYYANYRECLHGTARAQSQLVWAYKWYPMLKNLSKLVSPTFRSLWNLSEQWNDIVWHRATQRLVRYNSGEKLDDFFQALMEDKTGQPNNLEWGEIVAEVSIMMNAGSDTTAIAMNNVMFWLLKHPKCLEKLREEVDSVLDENEIVAPYDKVKHLPYLRACLDESLRIIPPTTFGLPRRTPPEGSYICGDWIPGETSVSMSAYVIHHNPEVFSQPDAYIPDRWLSEESKKLRTSFLSFSAGARGCIGRNISYLEQTVLLASVVHRYDFALLSDTWEPERVESMNLAPGPMLLKVWRRELEKET